MLKKKSKVIKTGTAKLKEIVIENFNPSSVSKKECDGCGTIVTRNEDKFVASCHICGGVTDFFTPTPFQEILIGLDNRIILAGGGFGSGKSVADAKKIQQHVLSIPNATVACFSQTEDQLHKNFKTKCLDSFFLDEWFVPKEKKFSSWKLKNGSMILFKVSNDAQKLRSASYTMSVIIEASKEQLYAVYNQLITRLRDPKAVVAKKDSDGNPIFEEDKFGQKRQVVEKEYSQLIIETNPTELWPKTEVLLKSKTIYHTSSVRGIPGVHQKTVHSDQDIVSVLSATPDNPMVTTEFINSLMADKPQWVINRDVYGDFSDRSRLIFGDLLSNIVEPFPIPANWPRIMSADPGIKDKFGILWGALDPVHRILYFFDEFYEDSVLLDEVSEAIRVQESKTGTSDYNTLIRLIDNKAGARQMGSSEFVTVKSLFEDYDLFFELAKKSGDKKADILASQTLFSTGAVKVFSSCTNFIRELSGYAWLISKDEMHFEEKVPVKDDHLIDPCRYIIMELGLNLRNVDLGEFNQKIYANAQMASTFNPMNSDWDPNNNDDFMVF